MLVKPTGPQGAIVERDVLTYLDGHTLSETDAVETIPIRGVRAAVAEHMHRSATITASVTLNAEADATALVDLRKRLLQDELDVSYNDLLLYILGQALQDHPRLNATLTGDTIKLWKPIHVGLGVDTRRGLLVPVIRDVNRKGLLELTQETRELVQRATRGQCTPEELDAGTFTLTNLGMFGIDSFTPIINLPESAILGVGRIKKRPAVLDEQLVARDTMWLSLTFDHRLVDGAPAASFLQQVVRLIEHPNLLLVRYLATP
jgi:pyruvate dehydrogenase E2 component (dihydrolipoamide acetyltransferase)